MNFFSILINLAACLCIDLYNILPPSGTTLITLLQDRTVGTHEHEYLSQYISSELQSFGWIVETDVFVEKTPIGNKQFTNIIAMSHDNRKNYVLLGAHYDMKIIRGCRGFQGAIDSAWSCAFLIELAKTISSSGFLLNKGNQDLGVSLVFFDGEEAFDHWTSQDSLYGSRHLAKKWIQNKMIYKINLFILLDLLGSANSSIYSYFRNTYSNFKKLVEIQTSLIQKKIITREIFIDRQETAFMIDDDHKPFLSVGVKVLHLIPMPFPREWHTCLDNIQALDIDSIITISKVLEHFLKSLIQVDLGKNTCNNNDFCLLGSIFE